MVSASRSVRVTALGLVCLAAFAQRPEFEVASVKVNTKGGDIDTVPRRSGDLVMMHNTQVYSMIFYAYHLTEAYQLAGFVLFTPNEWNWFDWMRGSAATPPKTSFV